MIGDGRETKETKLAYDRIPGKKITPTVAAEFADYLRRQPISVHTHNRKLKRILKILSVLKPLKPYFFQSMNASKKSWQCNKYTQHPQNGKFGKMDMKRQEKNQTHQA